METKVCHISTVHSCVDIRIFHKECISLAEHGFDVIYIHPGDGIQEHCGISLIGSEINGFKSRLKRMRAGASLTVKMAIDTNADVIHIHDGELVRFIKKIKKAGLTVVYDAHEHLPMQILEKEWLHPIFRPILSFVADRFEKHYSKYADLVVAVADKTCERFEKIGVRTVQVKNFPIAKEFKDIKIDFAHKIKKRMVCYSGAIWNERGLDTMCGAVSGIQNTKMIIAGRIDHPRKKEFIDNLSSNIEYKGFLTREKVFEIYEDATAGLCLFKPYPNNMIDPPTKIFEYMAAGIPVIASDFKSMSDIVVKYKCGICVNPLDIKQIQDAIEYLMNNPVEAEIMGRNGREAIFSKMNWEQHSEILLNEYKQLVGE